MKILYFFREWTILPVLKSYLKWLQPSLVSKHRIDFQDLCAYPPPSQKYCRPASPQLGLVSNHVGCHILRVYIEVILTIIYYYLKNEPKTFTSSRSISKAYNKKITLCQLCGKSFINRYYSLVCFNFFKCTQEFSTFIYYVNSYFLVLFFTCLIKIT